MPREPAPSNPRPVIPAPVVKRSPAPGLIVHPRPAVVVLPNPTPIAIRSPCRRHARYPNIAISRVVRPPAIGIQIFRAVNIRTHVLRRCRPKQIRIPLVTPRIPPVLACRRRNLILRFPLRGSHNHQRPLTQPLAAPRRLHLHFAMAHRHPSRRIRRHFHPNRRQAHRLHRHQRRRDLRRYPGFTQHPPRHQTLTQLNPVQPPTYLDHPDLRIARQPGVVCVVKLHLPRRLARHRNPIRFHQRSIQGPRHPLLAVPSLHQYISARHTQPSHRPARFIRFRPVIETRNVRGWRRWRRSLLRHQSRRSCQDQDRHLFHGGVPVLSTALPRPN